jgi:Ca-activated chloride channel family protein
MYLDYVDAETISSGTTALDTALSKAIETFANIPERKNKLVILFTDGEDFSLNLNPVKEAAGQQEIKIFTIGVGTPEGAPIPKIDLSGNRIDYEKDSSGNIILSKLNEELLSSTSKTLNGAYFRATQYDTDIDNIISQISKFEKEKFSDKKLSLYEEQYPLFLGIAWVLLVLEWIL